MRSNMFSEVAEALDSDTQLSLWPTSVSLGKVESYIQT